MRLKPVLLLIFLTLTVHANGLFNDFAGDDTFLISWNTFYRNPHNISRLLTGDRSLTLGERAMRPVREDKGSGSVSFRPAANATLFIDGALWPDNPQGYHAFNLLIHVLNVLLVFLLIGHIFGNPTIAFWTAALFAVHPLNSEPVSAIGFRQDLLVTFWVLMSALLWVKFREGRALYYVFFMFTLLLALCSKENAVPWVVWLFAYDRSRGIDKRALLKAYVFPAVLILCYLYIYLVVFPNTSFRPEAISSMQLLSLSSLSQIWWLYITYFFAPFLCGPIPMSYYPLPKPLMATPEFWLMGITIVGILTAVILYRHRLSLKHPVFLVLFWAVLTFLPVAGFILNPNPVACRYLYLPSVGLSAAFVAGGIACYSRFFVNTKLQMIGKILGCGFFLFCSIFCMINNKYWKSDISLGFYWVQRFPDSYVGHLVLGRLLGQNDLTRESIEHLLIAAKNPRCRNPNVNFYLALAYLQLRENEKALEQIHELSIKYSGFRRIDLLWGIYYANMGDYERAWEKTINHLKVEPSEDTLRLAVRLASQRKDRPSLDALIKRAPQIIYNPENLADFDKQVALYLKE